MDYFNRLPETLCRVTFNGYMVDERGYLLTHRARWEYRQYKEDDVYPLNHKPEVLKREMRVWLPIVPTHDITHVPLVHPCEWETIARWFHNRFRLITIDSSKIEDLEQIEHPAFVHGEYFGRVPQTAIISDEEYTWRESSYSLALPPIGEKFLILKGLFSFTKGFRPVALTN